MTLAEIVAITGLPGLFKIVGRRKDGLVVTSLVDDKTTFVSSRNHLFTTLDNVTIYSVDDDILLKGVFAEMKKQEASNPPKAKDDTALKAYIEKVIPNYDKEKVHVSDMKKLLKWYDILNAKDLIEVLTKEEEMPAEKEEVQKAEVKEVITPTTKKKTAKPKPDLNVKAATKPAPAAKKITAPRKAQ